MSLDLSKVVEGFEEATVEATEAVEKVGLAAIEAVIGADTEEATAGAVASIRAAWWEAARWGFCSL